MLVFCWAAHSSGKLAGGKCRDGWFWGLLQFLEFDVVRKILEDSWFFIPFVDHEGCFFCFVFLKNAALHMFAPAEQLETIY